MEHPYPGARHWPLRCTDEPRCLHQQATGPRFIERCGGLGRSAAAVREAADSAPPAAAVGHLAVGPRRSLRTVASVAALAEEPNSTIM